MAWRQLYEAAAAVRSNAYTPYSRFPVAAALLAEDGSIHVGVNVDNAAYPLSACAEANAVGALVTAGSSRIVAGVVIGGLEGDGLLCTPCGGCRQRMAEFATPETDIYLCGPEGLRARYRLADLLPAQFGSVNLLAAAEE